jgi:class 3 adenylate cyclase
MNSGQQSRVERRLAAILAADVAGYSRLMGADEEDTLERLKGLRRELLDPKIVERHGRIVRTIGDGMLVEFASVVDAVVPKIASFALHDSTIVIRSFQLWEEILLQTCCRVQRNVTKV